MGRVPQHITTRLLDAGKGIRETARQMRIDFSFILSLKSLQVGVDLVLLAR